MIGQQRPLDEHVLERRATVLVVARRAVPQRAMEVVAVVLGVFFPVDLADAGGLALLDLRLSVGLPLLGAVLAVDGGHLRRPFGLLVDLLLLEDRVLGELLVDERLELRPRDLEDLDRLPQLRRHHQLLGEPLLQDDAGVVRHQVLPRYYSRNFSPR